MSLVSNGDNPHTKSKKVAIAIPVRNEANGLKKLTKTLIAQMAPSDELIFVDTGSIDGTREIITRFTETYENVRLIVNEGAFCGGGRNMAIRQTDASIIAHVDGGNLPGRDWLAKLCAPIKAGTADYVTGNITFFPIRKRILGVDLDLGEIYGISLFRDFRRDSDGKMAGGSSVAYRRWIWEFVGGFPDWCRFGGEDVLFVEKMERLNIPIRKTFVKDAVVKWQIGPTLRDVLRRKMRFQADLFMLGNGRMELFRGCIIPATFMIAVALAFVLPFLRLPVGIMFLLEWTRQGIKAGRVFLKQSTQNNTARKKLVSLCVLFALEGLNLFSRMVGIIVGLLAFRENREFQRKAQEYLKKAAAV